MSGIFLQVTPSRFTPTVSPSLPNEDGEEFGESRLVEALRRHRNLPLPNLLFASLVDALFCSFSPTNEQDDITLLVARVLNDRQRRAKHLFFEPKPGMPVVFLTSLESVDERACCFGRRRHAPT